MHLYIKPGEQVSVNIEAVVPKEELKTFYFLPIETRQDDMSLKLVLDALGRETHDVFGKGQCHILAITMVRNVCVCFSDLALTCLHIFLELQ